MARGNIRISRPSKSQLEAMFGKNPHWVAGVVMNVPQVPVSPTPTPSVTPTSTVTPTPSVTPTNTVTPSVTATSTVTPTPSVTPTNTPTPSSTPPPQYHLQAENTDNILAENSDYIDIEHT